MSLQATDVSPPASVMSQITGATSPTSPGQGPLQLGPYTLPNRVFAAPMAGVTDRPYRILCRRLGAGHAVSEMAASNPQLWESVKTARRLDHRGEPGPIAVQLAGADPAMMAEAARYNIDRGAQIIDLNMGCPAKKVCKVAAGSALLRQEDLIARIIEAVVAVCAPRGVPVTLKTRTGYCKAERNVMRVAQRAESLGIALLTIHGRTREDLYMGDAEYDTIAAVRQVIKIPLVANGDIASPQKALQVLKHTGADAVMVGRAAQGRPWIFREIASFLNTGTAHPPPTLAELRDVLLEHLKEHVAFHGPISGVRTARKHIAWYLDGLAAAAEFLPQFMRIEDADAQFHAIDDFLRQNAAQSLSDSHTAPAFAAAA